MPDPNAPILFYSNQTRQDIKLTICRALSRAHRCIYLMMYGITDPQVIAVLQRQFNRGIETQIHYDKSASSNLNKIFPLAAHPFPSKGLMHRKILVIDETTTLLGSANLTTASLKHHDNLVVGIYSPELARFLSEEKSGSPFLFKAGEQPAELWLLPDGGRKSGALAKLIREIDLAKNSISLALFTFTHPQVAEALVRAHLRGVKVKVALDLYTARGASRKTANLIEKAGIPLFLSRGQELLHHKWALIDEETLIVGSANWTLAAFAKNEDFLLYLYHLSQDQKKFMTSLWKVIEAESSD